MRLVAANGSPIKTFGSTSRQIKFGEKTYIFSFVVANIARPIIGIDFLQRFGMKLDLKSRQLQHSGITTSFVGTSCRSVGVNLVQDALLQVRNIFDEYPELVDVARATRSSKHNVQCYIKTAGPL